MNLDRLIQLSARTRAFVARHRLLLTLVALVVFGGGIAWSIGQLDLAWSDVRFAPLAMVLLVLVPAGVLVAAWNLQLLARVVGTEIDLGTAIMATAYGRVAEILPIPGAAIVRGMALMKSGAGARETAGVMAWSAVQTVAMAGMVASLPLFAGHRLLAGAIFSVSTVLTIACLGWLVRRLDVRIAAEMVFVRVATLALSVLRFYACFAALAFTAPLLTTAIFVIGGTLTTYIGIVPAGLGVSEIISAALALTVGIPAPVAFLAAALNRLSGLSSSAAIAFLCWIFRPNTLSEAK